MSEQTSDYQLKYGLLPTDIEGVDALLELTLDLRSDWNHSADDMWLQLDPELWQATRNPLAVLQTISRKRLAHLLSNATFRGRLEQLRADRRAAAQAPAWFQRSYPRTALNAVAYFSMEFMLSEALPIYSGGLGNVAGDQLKAAGDLGVPVIGVGLLYQRGYFRQMLDQHGGQLAFYPYNEPSQLPVTPVRKPTGEWLRLRLDMPAHAIWVRAWQAQVGRAKLYLLDTNDASNHPPYRAITSELYGGGPELRLMQEMVLGIGGWRLLAALGIEPQVCHLNEGHAALVVLERARSFMAATGQPFNLALTATRVANLFTTHTAVPAGFDRFSRGEIEHCLGAYAEGQLGIALEELLALGRRDPTDVTEDFNMAHLAIRGSGAVNAVSRLHGVVSRQLFSPLFPRWPLEEVPIGHITNGVHTPTWDSAPADALWTRVCGQERWQDTTESLAQGIQSVGDTDLWQLRSTERAALVAYVSERRERQRQAAGEPPASTDRAEQPLDASRLTIGFARRFATYKRPNLLLHDPARLLRLLNDPERPMQVVIAGKAHPADVPGQALIREWFEFSRRPEVAGRVVFLSDYDMHVAEHVVQGVDVWLNTPRRPWEASGTSGMKVLVNGGLNLSELDGWWAEAYTPESGWALGDGKEHGEDPAWDASEADALYGLLEQAVAPEFYRRDARGIPVEWVARMRRSMALLTPQYSSNRAVREYTERYYLSAAAAGRERAAQRGELAARLLEWRRALDERWPTLRFGAARVETVDGQHRFEIDVFLGELEPEAVKVDLYADAEGEAPASGRPMSGVPGAGGVSGHFVYSASAPATRAASDFTARIVPYHAAASVPLEVSHILWQR